MTIDKEQFQCKECNISIGGHNQYLHDGMCDDCFFEIYFSEEAEIVETDVEQIERHCKSKPVQRENSNFKRFVLEGKFDQERFANITKEIMSKLSCPNGGACCNLINDKVTSSPSKREEPLASSTELPAPSPQALIRLCPSLSL